MKYETLQILLRWQENAGVHEIKKVRLNGSGESFHFPKNLTPSDTSKTQTKR